jgi:prepilin-type N-terminal cleavage/methylation domain-containing protein
VILFYNFSVKIKCKFFAKKKRGFTLIELLVVIVIIGILSTIGVSSFRGAITEARDVAKLNAIEAIAQMVKIDSAGKTSNPYNYSDFTTLFSDHDFSLPERKLGFGYFYCFSDEDFFVAANAESLSATGAELIDYSDGDVLPAAAAIFVEGTLDGIDAAILYNEDDAAVNVGVYWKKSGYLTGEFLIRPSDGAADPAWTCKIICSADNTFESVGGTGCSLSL